jgi:Predicted branched-chain amino acid permease (azaleucine resistance)
MNKEHMKSGFSDSIPIMVGYIPIAIAYGLLSKTSGLSLVDTGLMSFMVFAGASQFMAVNLIASGVGFGEIVISTFLVNFRHFLMSASLSARLKEVSKRSKPIIAFGVTDEVFSVASFRKEELSTSYMLVLELSSYLSWCLGGILGYIIGQALPEDISSSMGIALYAMFAALLMPEVRERLSVGVLALLSALVNTLLYYFGGISKGWCIVIAIITASAVGATVFKEENKAGAQIEEEQLQKAQ